MAWGVPAASALKAAISLALMFSLSPALALARALASSAVRVSLAKSTTLPSPVSSPYALTCSSAVINSPATICLASVSGGVFTKKAMAKARSRSETPLLSTLTNSPAMTLCRSPADSPASVSTWSAVGWAGALLTRQTRLRTPAALHPVITLRAMFMSARSFRLRKTTFAPSFRGPIDLHEHVPIARPARRRLSRGPVFTETNEREAVQLRPTLYHEPAHDFLPPPAQADVGPRRAHVVRIADHVHAVWGIVRENLHRIQDGALGLPGEIGPPRLEHHAELLDGRALESAGQSVGHAQVDFIDLADCGVGALPRLRADTGRLCGRRAQVAELRVQLGDLRVQGVHPLLLRGQPRFHLGQPVPDLRLHLQELLACRASRGHQPQEGKEAHPEDRLGRAHRISFPRHLRMSLTPSGDTLTFSPSVVVKSLMTTPFWFCMVVAPAPATTVPSMLAAM